MKSHLTKLGIKIAANKCTSFHINGRCFCGTQQPMTTGQQVAQLHESYMMMMMIISKE
jgi:hypothetical protein